MKPRPGDIVTVTFGRRSVAQYRVYATHAATFAAGEALGGMWVPRSYFALHEEGITWCRGWSGPAVRALKVAMALS